MNLDTGAASALHDGNYINGEQYVYTTTLAAGSHTINFNASDGTTNVFDPGDGSFYMGPVVVNLTITTSSLAGGTVGAAYSTTVTASGGLSSYTWTAPGLPAGLSINSSTGAITGTPTTAGTYGFTVTVTDAGVAYSKTLSIVVAASTSSVNEFTYVANISDNSISAYAINPNTGELTAAGTTVATGTDPQAIAVDPKGRFVYVANFSSSDVSAYTINPSTGALTGVGAPVASGAQPFSIAIDPSGKFVYVANINGKNISSYTINQSNGALTEVGMRVGEMTSPQFIAVDPSGKYLYSTDPVLNIPLLQYAQ